MLPIEKSGFRPWLLGLPVSLALAAVALLLTAFGPTHQAALAASEGGPVQNLQTGLTYGSLGAAIAATETLDSHHLTIAAGNYTENITITKSLVITGAGQEVTILDGGGAGRVIYIPEAVTVTLSGVAVRNGVFSGDYGSGLFNEGTLSLANSKVYSNTNTDSYGGGIYSEGVITLTNVLIYINTAYDAAGFGNDGEATLTNVRIHDNVADSSAGGLANYGTWLSLTNVDLDHNTVLGPGGYGGGMDQDTSGGPAILNTVRIFANSVISGDSAYAGGGISVFYADGPLTMTNSAVFDNVVLSGGPGGGIHASYNARVWIIDSSIYNNRAPEGLGGGIDAGAAVGGAEVHIVNSTISGNSAAVGGGLHSADPRVYITNTTFYSNSVEFIVLPEETAVSGGGFGGNLSGTVTLANTLLADGYPDDCGYAPAVTSNGYNLEHITNSCGLAGPGDQPNANALLGPLARNGAALAENLSHLPLRGSDAIDAGSNVICNAWLGGHDQRGWARPVNTCDIGAVEAGLELFLPLILR